MTITDKVIAITGAGSGIGRASARRLGSLGAKIILGARRADAIAEVTDEINAAGGIADYRTTDVTRKADLEALVAHACTRFGRLDVLINNAGISPMSRLDAVRVDEWDAMIDVNLRGVLHGIAAALPVFQKQDGGHIINVVSTAGLRISPGMGVYAATKNAVRTITEALRQEAGPHLRVTEVSPGFVATDLTSSITDENIRTAMKQRMDEMAIPPEAIAKAIAFAVDQPLEVDVGSVVIRPTAQD